MASTSRDYAPKHAWIDPVVEIEQLALERGFRKGVFYTLTALVATFVIVDFLAHAAAQVTTRVIPWLQAVL